MDSISSLSQSMPAKFLNLSAGISSLRINLKHCFSHSRKCPVLIPRTKTSGESRSGSQVYLSQIKSLLKNRS